MSNVCGIQVGCIGLQVQLLSRCTLPMYLNLHFPMVGPFLTELEGWGAFQVAKLCE